MHNPTRCLLVLAAVAALCAPAHAATVVTGDSLPWNGGFSSLSRNVPRAMQQFYDADFFTSIAQPVQITAMSWRLPAVANTSYPTADITFSQYDVTLAKASVASSTASNLASLTFADNMVDPVVVRSGSLTISANSFTDSDPSSDPLNPADFSYLLTFTTPYTYTPGDDLVMLVRHSGHGDATQISWNFDGYAWTQGSVVNTTNANAASGGYFNNGNKIQFTYVPEPATIGLLALGAMGLLRRRGA